MHPPAPTASRRPPRMTVFDGATSEAGYAFNRFGFSLVREANRTRYLADPEGYMDGFAIPAAQRALFAARDWAGLVEAGASVYIVAKLTGMHGSTLLDRSLHRHMRNICLCAPFNPLVYSLLNMHNLI